ncbi:MAG: hypothetical protein QXP32_09425 [Nitrososphaeria archaeon]
MSQVLLNQALLDIITERWGYYFGKRILQSELMKRTVTERKTIRELNEKINEKINNYLSKGIDVREDVIALKTELTKVKTELSQKSQPYNEKIRTINKVLSYLDKEVIPSALENITGKKILPITDVNPDLILANKKQ